MNEVSLKQREEPERFFVNNGRYCKAWNQRVFHKPGALFWTVKGYGQERFILINSYRDRMLHITVYRMLSETGRTIHVNCMDVISHLNK
jgi:hypothetical protein